jgi:hypothetical protein
VSLVTDAKPDPKTWAELNFAPAVLILMTTNTASQRATNATARFEPSL